MAELAGPLADLRAGPESAAELIASLVALDKAAARCQPAELEGSLAAVLTWPPSQSVPGALAAGVLAKHLEPAALEDSLRACDDPRTLLASILGATRTRPGNRAPRGEAYWAGYLFDPGLRGALGAWDAELSALAVGEFAAAGTEFLRDENLVGSSPPFGMIQRLVNTPGHPRARKRSIQLLNAPQHDLFLRATVADRGLPDEVRAMALFEWDGSQAGAEGPVAERFAREAGAPLLASNAISVLVRLDGSGGHSLDSRWWGETLQTHQSAGLSEPIVTAVTQLRASIRVRLYADLGAILSDPNPSLVSARERIVEAVLSDARAGNCTREHWDALVAELPDPVPDRLGKVVQALKNVAPPGVFSD